MSKLSALIESALNSVRASASAFASFEGKDNNAWKEVTSAVSAVL